MIAAKRKPMADRTGDGTLTEMQARMLGQAIAVAAHCPASIALLDKIDAEFGVSMLRRDTGVAVESWNAGGCHIFAKSLSQWINLNKGESESDATLLVYASGRRMVHVITSWQGWLFDDRGAWSGGEFDECYRKFDGCLVPYVASKFYFERIPRRARYVKSLRSILAESLMSPSEWTPNAAGFAWCGQSIIRDRISRILAEPRYATQKQRHIALARRTKKK